MPENLGFTLDVHRGNVVKRVKTNSPAADLGFEPGDVVDALGGHSVRSFADAQYALDKAPQSGHLNVVWQRGVNRFKGRINLLDGWRRTDIGWRPSVKHLVASPRLFGEDLSVDERRALGLSSTRLAFRQKRSVPRQAREAGILPADVILGFDDKQLEMDASDFQDYVAKRYIVGDRVDINVIRDGQRMTLEMTLQ